VSSFYEEFRYRLDPERDSVGFIRDLNAYISDLIESLKFIEAFKLTRFDCRAGLHKYVDENGVEKKKFYDPEPLQMSTSDSGKHDIYQGFEYSTPSTDYSQEQDNKNVSIVEEDIDSCDGDEYVDDDCDYEEVLKGALAARNSVVTSLDDGQGDILIPNFLLSKGWRDYKAEAEHSSDYEGQDFVNIEDFGDLSEFRNDDSDSDNDEDYNSMDEYTYYPDVEDLIQSKVDHIEMRVRDLSRTYVSGESFSVEDNSRNIENNSENFEKDIGYNKDIVGLSDDQICDAIEYALVQDDDNVRSTIKSSISMIMKSSMWDTRNDMNFIATKDRAFKYYEANKDQLYEFGHSVIIDSRKEENILYSGYSSSFIHVGQKTGIGDQDIEHLVGVSTMRGLLPDTMIKDLMEIEWDELDPCYKDLYGYYFSDGQDVARVKLGTFPIGYNDWKNFDSALFESDSIFKDEFEAAFLFSKYEMCRTFLALPIVGIRLTDNDYTMIDEWLIYILSRAVVLRRNYDKRYDLDEDADQDWFFLIRGMTQYEMRRIVAYTDCPGLASYMKRFLLSRYIDNMIGNLIAFVKGRDKMYGVSCI